VCRAPFADPFFNFREGHPGEYSTFVVEGRVSVLEVEWPLDKRFPPGGVGMRPPKGFNAEAVTAPAHVPLVTDDWRQK
jgi:hypothetical protein